MVALDTDSSAVTAPVRAALFYQALAGVLLLAILVAEQRPRYERMRPTGPRF